MNVTRQTGAIFDSVNSALAGVATVLLVLVALAIPVNVLLRYSLGISFAGLFELTEFSLLWITFLGAAWLLRKDGHVNIDLVITRLEPRSRILANIVTFSISTILFGIITWYGVKVTLQDFQTNFILGTVLEPPKWPVEAIIPIGSFLLFIQLLRKTYGHLVSWKALSH